MKLLSITKFQWCNRLRLGLDKLLHLTLYWAWDYLSMLRLKLIHVKGSELLYFCYCLIFDDMVPLVNTSMQVLCRTLPYIIWICDYQYVLWGIWDHTSLVIYTSYVHRYEHHHHYHITTRTTHQPPSLSSSPSTTIISLYVICIQYRPTELHAYMECLKCVLYLEHSCYRRWTLIRRWNEYRKITLFLTYITRSLRMSP